MQRIPNVVHNPIGDERSRRFIGQENRTKHESRFSICVRSNMLVEKHPIAQNVIIQQEHEFGPRGL
jgi:hypothetical protein